MKILGRKAASCAAIVVALTSLILLRAIPKDKDDVPNVKFTLRTELVLIPTVVTDKSGNHISGLKKEDFTVLENSAEPKITTFEEVSSTPNRFSRPDVPNEFSNSVAADPSSRRITLIMLDLINTRFADQATAREELLKYLTQSVDVREPTALYTLDRTGIHVIHDLPPIHASSSPRSTKLMAIQISLSTARAIPRTAHRRLTGWRWREPRIGWRPHLQRQRSQGSLQSPEHDA
jgi:hypothetical protein